MAAAAVLSAVALQAQTQAGGRIPRTADGKPDLQGIWSNATQTPLQRPAALGTKAMYSDAEFAKLTLRDHDGPPPAGDPGTYNQFWWEEGGLLKQTSLIVDPPNGRIPPLTTEGERRRKALQALGNDPGDSPEERNLAERCLTRGAPKLPGGYNNNFQVVQTPTHVMMFQEMIHEARIIPIDGRPHLPPHIRGFLGDSRAHWEGDTLVVDTTNYRREINQNSFNCCGGATEHLTIVERFTLADADTIDYRYTVNDPVTFTAPWTVSVPMHRVPGPIYEYACHEGNEAMIGILRGHRAEDR
jgi:hypothetical protein